MSDIQDFVSDIPTFVEHEFSNVADINIEKLKHIKTLNTCRNIFSRICEKAIKKGWKCNISENSIDGDVWNKVMLNVRK